MSLRTSHPFTWSPEVILSIWIEIYKLVNATSSPFWPQLHQSLRQHSTEPTSVFLPPSFLPPSHEEVSGSFRHRIWWSKPPETNHFVAKDFREAKRMLFFHKPADEFFEDKKKQSGKVSCFQRVRITAGSRRLHGKSVKTTLMMST